MAIEAVGLLLQKRIDGILFSPKNLGSGRFHPNPLSTLDAALCVFDDMLRTRPLPSAFTFTPLLGLLTKIKRFSTSIHCFKQMCAAGVPLNNQTACILINSYSHLHQTKHALTVLACCFKHGILPDHTWTYNTLIKGFIREDKTHEAHRLFNKLIRTPPVCQPNLATYNTMITGLCKIGDTFAAIGLLRLMDARGCKPNVNTYNIIMASLCKDLMVDDAFKLLEGMGSSPNVDTYNSLINALCKLDRWDEVSTMIKQMEDVNVSPDIKTFNVIVDALCKRASMEEAEAVVDIMYDNFGMRADTVTVNSLIYCHCLRGDMTSARECFAHMLNNDIHPNVDTYNIMLEGYCRNVNPFQASLFYDLLFGTWTKPNKVARNILAMERQFFSMRSYHDMIELPMDHPYISFLQPESGAGNTYEDALALFRFMDGIDSSLNSHIKVYNILIDGALKRGKFDTARRLFHDLFVKGLQPDADTYTMMIGGFCEIGLLRDASKLVFEMDRCIPELKSNNNSRWFASLAGLET